MCRASPPPSWRPSYGPAIRCCRGNRHGADRRGGRLLLVTAALAAAFHLAFETTVWPQGAVQWLSVLALGLGPVGAAFYVWDFGVKHGDIRVLGALSYAAPVLSTVFLVLAGIAPATAALAFATVLITGGGLIAAKDLLWRISLPGGTGSEPVVRASRSTASTSAADGKLTRTRRCVMFSVDFQLVASPSMQRQPTHHADDIGAKIEGAVFVGGPDQNHRCAEIENRRLDLM